MTRERSDEHRECHSNGGEQHEHSSAPVGALERTEANANGARRAKHADEGLVDREADQEGNRNADRAP